jgi:hypothetical protein
MRYGQVRLVVCQQELLPSQEQLKNDIGAIRAVQNKSERRRTVMLDKQLKDIIAKLNSWSRIYIRGSVVSCRRHRCTGNSIQPQDHKAEARNAVDSGRSPSENLWRISQPIQSCGWSQQFGSPCEGHKSTPHSTEANCQHPTVSHLQQYTKILSGQLTGSWRPRCMLRSSCFSYAADIGVRYRPARLAFGTSLQACLCCILRI